MSATAPRLIRHVAPYKPLPWQVEAWKDTSFIHLYTGSAGGGKSRCAAELVHGYLQRYPGATALALRKTRESANNSIVLFLKHTVIGDDPRVVHYPSYSRFEYPNGSWLLYGGMKNEEQREQIRSIGVRGGLDLVWMEEAVQFHEDDYNELLARMRGVAAGWMRVILTTNPGPPGHWIYKRLILGGEARVYTSTAYDNFHNPSQYLAALKQLTGVLYRRLVLGQWVQTEGAVYDTFDEQIHVVNELPSDPYYWKKVFATVDWGYTNPGVIQVWGVDGDGRLWLLHETYHTHQLVESWWAAEAKRLKEQWHVQYFACDPSEPAYIEALRKFGQVSARPANNELKAGIERVQKRLALAGDGKPRILFYRYASSDPDTELERRKLPVNTLEEISLYSWATSRDGTPMKEEPQDLHNHGMDCLRYAVNEQDGKRGVFLA